MSNVVIDFLIEHFRHLKIVLEPTPKSFTNDRENTGDKREITVATFIRDFLSPDYRIFKGSIYSKESFSKSIDCVVLSPNHPSLNEIRSFALAEGVYAAIEVKPDITSLTENSEFHRGLLQIQSVKRLEREIVDINELMFDKKRLSYFYRIPCVIFSFKSQSIFKIGEYMQEAVLKGLIAETELPDIVVSLNEGLIFYSPHIRESIFKVALDNYATVYPDKLFALIHEKDEKILLWFLMLFLRFVPPVFYITQSMLLRYLTIDTTKVEFHPLYNNDSIIKKNPTT